MIPENQTGSIYEEQTQIFRLPNLAESAMLATLALPPVGRGRPALVKASLPKGVVLQREAGNLHCPPRLQTRSDSRMFLGTNYKDKPWRRKFTY